MLDICNADDPEGPAIAVAVLAVAVVVVGLAIAVIVPGVAAVAVEALLGSAGAHLDGIALARLLITVIALRVLTIAGHGIDDGADHAAVVPIAIRIHLGACGRRDRGE